MTTLAAIAANLPRARLVGDGGTAVTGLTADSREVRPGTVFAAVAGSRGDGAEYVAGAVRAGAGALLLGREPGENPGVPYIVVPDVRKGLGEAADVFYNHPARELLLIGVTGTNGKTTTAYLLRHILNVCKIRSGMLGTIEYDLGGELLPSPLTTPGPVRFTESLRAMADAGCRAAVVETSSHALAQDRVWPHYFVCGVFTNLTRDHLDYHGDMEHYLEAKRLLFTRLDSGAAAIFNYGDPNAGRMAEGVTAQRFGYVLAGKTGSTTNLPDGILTAAVLDSDLAGQRIRVKGYGIDSELALPLVGRHNAENCLGAVLAALSVSVDFPDIARAIASFPGVPGRLERIAADDGRVAFVDYAHTDDALRSVLSVLRPLTAGGIITVFGCGGDRDAGKRPLMAKAAEEGSTRVILTSDNPRTEDPGQIIRDVMAGFAEPDKVAVEPDRPAAIRLAARLAKPGDVILVAGKGHEDYQIVGTEKQHMDDRELVREAFGSAGISAREGRRG